MSERVKLEGPEAKGRRQGSGWFGAAGFTRTGATAAGGARARGT